MNDFYSVSNFYLCILATRILHVGMMQQFCVKKVVIINPVTEDPIDIECIPNFLYVVERILCFFCSLSLSSLYRSVVNTLVLCMPFLFHNSLFLSVCLVVVSVSHRLFGATVRILNSNIETWYTSHVHIIVIVIGGK